MKNEHKGLGFGIFLLIVGTVWLLYIFKIVNIDTVYALIKLWPLILVAAGISFIFRNSRFIRTGVWLALLAGIICYGYYGNPGQVSFFIGNRDAGERETVSFEKKEGIGKGELRLRYGAAKLNIDSSESKLLDADIDTDLVSLSDSLKDNGSTAVFDFRMKRFDFSRLDEPESFKNYFRLGRDMVWDIRLDTGAVDCELELSDLKVEKLDVNTGASEFKINMGSYNTELRLGGGASKIDITLPPDTGIKVKLDGGVNSTNLDDKGWTVKDKWHYSPGYDEKEYKVTADINMGLGNLKIR